MLHPLRNAIQPYDWGSTTAVAELMGRPPTGEPEAEVWMGAHPKAPSQVCVDGRWLPLGDHIASDPSAVLGDAVVARFGPTLPFLLKILAAAQPLSLQVHPTVAQAESGYDAEEARGVALGAPERTYRDRNHKPELLAALGPFEALAGFRTATDAADVLDALGAGDPWVARLRAGELDGVFWDLWALDGDERRELVDKVVDGAARAGERYAAEAGLVARCAELHPGDVGIVVALLLNRVHLDATEAIYAPAGRLHAYLDGLGVEIMASSDNVVRGGLTTKHVDLDELRRILTVRPEAIEPLRPAADGTADGEAVYATPAPEFRLSRLEIGGDAALTVEGPEIVLCTQGSVSARPGSDGSGGMSLGAGESAFVDAAARAYVLGGSGVVFRATVGELG
ncbi:MAG: mannose-6-phosphate isomerase, class I [Actinomycetota bacterium]|nr:mannose-6-phosphate isomerase, class I [Actinomycetota bacterium]